MADTQACKDWNKQIKECCMYSQPSPPTLSYCFMGYDQDNLYPPADSPGPRCCPIYDDTRSKCLEKGYYPPNGEPYNEC